MIWVVDRWGRIAVVTVADYILLPTETVENTHVFFSPAAAFNCAASIKATQGATS